MFTLQRRFRTRVCLDGSLRAGVGRRHPLTQRSSALLRRLVFIRSFFHAPAPLCPDQIAVKARRSGPTLGEGRYFSGALVHKSSDRIFAT